MLIAISHTSLIAQVFYDTALWVTVREIFVYSWIKLLCDTGNIFCLLLGASVLSFFEIVEYVVEKMMIVTI